MGLYMQKYSELSCLVACLLLRLQYVPKKDQLVALIQKTGPENLFFNDKFPQVLFMAKRVEYA